MDIAKSQLGYNERDAGWTKFGQWYYENIDDNTYFCYADWCAMFCGWCQYQAGVTPNQTVFTASAGDTGVSLYKAKGIWHDNSYTPQSGDLIHFTWGHVGIVDYVSNGYVHTVEGNYSDSVARCCYSLDYNGIRGYAVPQYDDKIQGCDEMNFSFGDKSDGVLALKAMLDLAKKLGVVSAGVDSSDNSFGSGTLNAVKEIQRKYSLEVDGVAGVNTITALRKAIANNMASGSEIKNGDVTISSYELKTLLKLAREKSIINAQCDDKWGFGGGTLECVKEFQKAAGLEIDGIVGRKTVEMLRTRLLQDA
ncbi:MAG TPA: CHAP domain-containing protein [Clostridiales bacterium]|nr:CHAP domain-containing protein [Clostridiales bacterium]